MSRRLKVLISAYACEPNKGSEPEIGWQWDLQMARFHDVTVLTRANNRSTIEKGLESIRGQQSLPTFVFHDRDSFLLKLKRKFGLTKLYYLLWQRSGRKLIRQLHKVHQYEVMHHVTFSSFRYPTAVWGHGVPCIWGPIGGIESIPTRLLPWHHPSSLLHEVLRNFSNLIQTAPHLVLARRARATTLLLAATSEMQQTFKTFGHAAELIPSVGLKPREVPCGLHRISKGPLKLLFVGNILTLKGIDLALDALKESETDATFTLFGTGNYFASAKKRAEDLGLAQRVNFAGRLPREQVLKVYPDFDVFMFPSLHDTGGYAVIEAMFNRLPVICLDCGGPAVTVRAGCGVKVAVGQRAALVADLAAAIKRYDSNRSTMLAEGDNAREAILKFFDWDKKGEHMSELYLATANRKPGEKRLPGGGQNRSEMERN